MSGRSIEVPDPDPAAVPTGPRPDSPYKNLLVPLVVVPFVVVGVLVLVFVFFGAVGAEEVGLAENLRRLSQGGTNESKQAAMSLVAQAVENKSARTEGRSEPWPLPPDFQSALDAAWEEIGDDPLQGYKRLALAQFAALYRYPGARAKLESIIHLPQDVAADPESASVVFKLRALLSGVDVADHDGQLRLYAMLALTWLEDPSARAVVIPFLQDQDPYVRIFAAGVLQQLPGPETQAALRALLDDASLELRGQAAVSLSHLGDDAGAAVLLELADAASYAAVRAQDPKKFELPQYERDSRIKAIRAMGRLEREQFRARLEAIAAADGDPLVREAAMKVLAGP
jgi:hypothetical protein